MASKKTDKLNIKIAALEEKITEYETNDNTKTEDEFNDLKETASFDLIGIKFEIYYINKKNNSESKLNFLFEIGLSFRNNEWRKNV